MQHLLRAMICPDPAYRITAIQAYHHPALQPSAPSVIITPHFVRAAASFDIEDEPKPPLAQKADTEKKGKKCRNKKKDAKDQSRASTPTALGESIKQHTSVSRPKARQREGLQGVQWEERTPSPKKDSKLVIKWTSHEDLLAIADGEDKESQDPTRKSVRRWCD